MKYVIKLLQLNKKAQAENIKRQVKICNASWLPGTDKQSKKIKRDADKQLALHRDIFSELHNAIGILKATPPKQQ